MAKKISKNSRAARQYDLTDLAPKELQNLPRAENTDLTNIMIRTAAKNESLLEAKIRKKKDSKNKVSKKDFEMKIAKSVKIMEKERLERALNITNRLDGKIAKSISRAKYVQSSRKAGWDSINASIKKELLVQALEAEEEEKKNEEAEKEGDIEVDEMYDSAKIETTTEVKPQSVEPQNLFALLPLDTDE